MTPEELDEIDAFWTAARRTSGIGSLCGACAYGSIPDLISSLRAAWAEIEKLRAGYEAIETWFIADPLDLERKPDDHWHLNELKMLVKDYADELSSLREITDEKIVRGARALAAVTFGFCQPDHGDVFGWVDDHKAGLARAVLEAVKEGG